MTEDSPLSHPQGPEAAPPGWRMVAGLRWLLVVLMVGVAAASYGYGDRKASETTTETDLSLYTCPMDPQVIQRGPGHCPLCGMTLVPMNEARATGEPEVAGLVPLTLDAGRIQRMGLLTVIAQRKPLQETARAPARVGLRETGVTLLAPRFPGWVESLEVDPSGQAVRAGQILARVVSPELLAAARELQQARQWQKEGGAGLDLAADARRRLTLMGLDPNDITALEGATEPPPTFLLRAPRSGYAVALGTLPGQAWEAGTPLFQVADLSQVWVSVDLYPEDQARMALGAETTLTFPALPGQTFHGQVTRIAPIASTPSGAGGIRIELPNDAGVLKPGMIGQAELMLKEAEGVVLPSSALIDTGERTYVFLALPGHRLVPRLVKAGIRTSSQVEIREGLSPGDSVVAVGTFLLDAESRVGAAAWALAPPPSPSTPPIGQEGKTP